MKLDIFRFISAINKNPYISRTGMPEVKLYCLQDKNFDTYVRKLKILGIQPLAFETEGNDGYLFTRSLNEDKTEFTCELHIKNDVTISWSDLGLLQRTISNNSGYIKEVDLSGLKCEDPYLSGETIQKGIEKVTLPYFTNPITSARELFKDSKLTTLNLSNVDLSTLIDAERMFSGCDILETMDLTSTPLLKLQRAHSMFAFCEKLKSVKIKLHDVTEIRGMFQACRELEEVDLTGSNLQQLNVFDNTSIPDAFKGCNKLDHITYNGPDEYTAGLIKVFNKHLHTPIKHK